MQLENLASLAATLSHLVHGEGVRNLHSVYQILEFLIAGDISLPNINLLSTGTLQRFSLASMLKSKT